MTTEERIVKHKLALEILGAIDSEELLLEDYEKSALAFVPNPCFFLKIETAEDLDREIENSKEKIKKLEDRYIIVNESF